ncbi:MAG TPA: flavodoxin [Bacteroidales bacterium]|nr:flavodoxin [Bacteroidales bacterium]
MKKTGLIYSFNSPRSARLAKKIQDELGKDNIDMINAEDITEEKFLSYDNLILGVPTWFDGELPNYWDEFVPALEDMNLKGKTIAIFGAGDQKGYPENFVDGIGIMADLLSERGARIIGETSAEGYSFENSKAFRNGKFIGLALDLDNHSKLIDDKIKDWAGQLKKDFK